MRVIAGTLGGRQFNAPNGHRTHPMGDRVRGGLFNTLGDITGLTVLDAFAGSGALAVEAISRGAESVVAVDIDKKAAATIYDNTQALGISELIKPIRANISSWSDKNLDKQFDLVLVDPPYDDLQEKNIQKLVKHSKANSTFVVAWPGKLQPPQFSGLNQQKVNNYGDAQLVFYKKTG